jgi:23S rRNA (pseudouridine1915-N3)-methyltransferase
MSLILLCVGKLKTPWVANGCAEYASRLRSFEIKEIPASKERDPMRQKEEEGERLLAAAEKLRGELWILDETGKTFTSKGFADFLGKAADAGRPLTFVLGGAYGLSDEVKAAARGSIRLSDMTFPHEFCRLVALEQLYRAQEIRKGSGYHH